MAYYDFLSAVHKSTKRDYLARVNDRVPQGQGRGARQAMGFDYWDGSRKINYGGYNYDGRWAKVASAMIEHYGIKPGDKILDIGCGKGFLLYDFTQVCPGVEVVGVDISDYALNNAKEEIKGKLHCCNANQLPFDDDEFDLVVSITTLHNLYIQDLFLALKEMERVGKTTSICVWSPTEPRKKKPIFFVGK